MSHPAGQPEPDDRRPDGDMGIDPKRGRKVVLSTVVAAILVVAAAFLVLFQCGDSADDAQGRAAGTTSGTVELVGLRV